MTTIGHPAYAAVDMEAVGHRAMELPEDGVPPAVLSVIKVQSDDASHDKLQPQKAATPTDGRHASDSAAGEAFATQRPKGIAAEGLADQDPNQTMVAELQRIKDDLMPPQERHHQTLEVRTGNVLVDQFNGLYMPLAFPFLFPYGTGRPDVVNHTSDPGSQPAQARRRKDDAPEVSIDVWAAAMQRRVETQFRRDWVFIFVIWNYLFRTMVNLMKNTCAYTVMGKDGKGKQMLTPGEIAEAAASLLAKLRGTYTDRGGKKKAVGGDLSKLRHAALSEAEQKVLANVEARTRQIPGTHEIRKTMRHQTHANRVCYGTSIFVTFSPSERDSQLMVRLARARQSDPAMQHDPAPKLQSRSQPDLDVEYLNLAPEALAQTMLSYDDRVALLARDPVACAEGFNILVLLALTIYEDPEAWRNHARAALEEEWPEYRNSSLMVGRPQYQSDVAMAPTEWKHQYLVRDVEHLQQHKQHHVHLPHGPEGRRLPLAHCRDPKDPTKCKAGFPKDKQLASEPWLVCPARAEEAGLPSKGKRNAVGLVLGPRNDPDVNGNHPALLVALRCNGDVQVPYRLPCIAETHDERCPGQCHLKASSKELVRAAQRNQAAQAGYACDYQNKRLPIAINEIKEWGLGQRSLGTQLHDKPAGYVGARVAKRLITDCYGRGVVRGAAECFELIAHARDYDPTSAESIKTAPTTTVWLTCGLKLLQASFQGAPWPPEPSRAQKDTREGNRPKLIACPPVTLYGGRGQQAEVWELSFYEFVRHYWLRLAYHPTTKASHNDNIQASGAACFHADLTEAGAQLLVTSKGRPALKPGEHYAIRETGGEDWLPLGGGEHAQPHRHDWIIVPRPRPYVPVLPGAQWAKSLDEQTMIVLLLFVPWTNDPTQATDTVPHISSLRRHYMKDWRHASRARLNLHGFPTDEVKRLVQNFCFVYCLPRDLAPAEELMENSDNEVEDDEPLALSFEDKLAIRSTHIRGGRSGEVDDASDADPFEANEAADGATQQQRTKQMFEISKNIWLRAEGEGAVDLRLVQHHQAYEAKVSARPPLTAAQLKEWLNSDAVHGHTNAKQFEFLEHVVERVLVEYDLVKPEDTRRKSIELLAMTEHRLRSVVPSANEWKHNAVGTVRPFGGINVVFTGDFHQLPPPSGGYLGDVPHSLRGRTDEAADPMVEHGRELFWLQGVQGVTELEERQRCKDPWWNEFNDELRDGRLSVRNWRYVHGMGVEGCTLSAEERSSRCRVVTSCADPRLQLPKFKDAVVIVANNDARYQINKDRAEAYGRESGAVVRWAIACDRASSAALQTKPCDKRTKMQWLQLPDRSTGDLCGALPLAIGMPVALTDHWDRSEDKSLLRGSRGHVHSWVWAENDDQPSVVFVKFENADWQLEGTPEPGIYPVWPVKRAWYLDASRDKPVLKVTRKQVPLTPAFALTAHGSQGKTLRAAMADLNVDKRTDITFGTVATSRVQSREDFLILRPFPLWLYQRGAPEGPALMLQILRGEEVDWELYREARAPMAPCKACGVLKQLDCFSFHQWECARSNRPAQCMLCSNSGNGPDKRKSFRSKLTKQRCASCCVYKIQEAFPKAQLSQEHAEDRQRCLTCCKASQFLFCGACRETKQVDAFAASMVTCLQGHAVCTSCQESAHAGVRRGQRLDWFTCKGCSQFLPRTAATQAAQGKQVQHCTNCASGTQWKAGQQTCRKCGAKWAQEMPDKDKRIRRCPKCRK
ncbi:unnamed protein product [Cladocopium goreaui]|uniref:ATP-dependent DNA helicase n=1 Tax=Cladocopium goreaui TaxID=2562237 RepID=A0A9P1FIQ5_9DINO|nr:unnamed protein product [Cladocopium goreaui]